MKKIALIFVLILIVAGTALAEGTAEAYGFMLGMAMDDSLPAQQVIKKDISEKNLIERARKIFEGNNYGYTRLTYYSLAQGYDKTYYLYESFSDINKQFDGPITLYQSDEKLTKEAVQRKAEETTEAVKVIDSKYIVFKIGSSFNGKFYLKDPQGDFYSINKVVKKAADSSSFESLGDFFR